MTFTNKDWKDLPDQSTPLSATAIEDLEMRLSGYSDTLNGSMNTRVVTLESNFSKATFINVKDAPYNALGNGSANDTSAIQAAIDAANAAGGGTVYFPRGTYMFTTLTLRDNVVLLGESRLASILKTSGPASAQSALLVGSGRSGITVTNLTIDGNGHANAAAALYITGSGTDKNFALRGCRIQNFTTTNGFSPVGQACGIYSWTADNVIVESNEFVSNNYDVYMDSPGNDCRVINNRIWSTGGHTARLAGITIRSNANGYSGALVAHNTIEDVLTDAGGIGIYGHAINVSGCQKVRVIANSTNNTICAGIHIGGGSYGATVMGNTILNSASGSASALYIELNIGDNNTNLGTDSRLVGAIIANNIIDTSGSYGISASYSAGTVIRGNQISNCQREGVFTDSYCVSIVNNHLHNNYISSGAPNPSSAPNVKAQVRCTTGNRCVVSNNMFTYSGAALPAQVDYCVAVGNGSHRVYGNEGLGASKTALYFSSGNTNWFAPDQSRTVASAGTLVPNVDDQVITLSGTTTVTSITATWKGHTLILYLSSTAQITDGGNILLSANSTGAALRTLTLFCDGTNWVETARSTN